MFLSAFYLSVWRIVGKSRSLSCRLTPCKRECSQRGQSVTSGIRLTCCDVKGRGAITHSVPEAQPAVLLQHLQSPYRLVSSGEFAFGCIGQDALETHSPHPPSWGTRDSRVYRCPTVVNAQGSFAVPFFERVKIYLRDDVCVALRAVL